jgi:death on curing protein
MNWRWVKIETVLAIHDEQLAEHGGPSGIRSLDLLESALARPQDKAHYSNPSPAELAAAYAFGIVKNHPFLDGHKRTALVVAETFLALNGFDFTATDEECVTTFDALAAGEMTEAQLGAWFARAISRMRPASAKKDSASKLRLRPIAKS